MDVLLFIQNCKDSHLIDFGFYSGLAFNQFKYFPHLKYEKIH